jgi:phosphoglycerate dehydrogenase-like enzyme
MKMLLLGQVPDERLAALRGDCPGVEFVSARSPEAQLAQIVDADAVYGWPRPEALRAARRLRWVHVGGAGIEQIGDLPELVAREEIALTNGRGTMARSVADHAFALILTFTRRLRDLADDQQARRWTRDLRLGQMRELCGSVLGIVGLGQIGGHVARRGAGFEMEVYAVDAAAGGNAGEVGAPRGPEGPGQGGESRGAALLAAAGGQVRALWGLERLDDLLRLADFLVVTVPATPQTRHLIDARRLALLRPGAYLVVVSRGGLVDEGALVAALRAGRLAGAGLDVAATEPLPPESPLWDAPNLLLTPHCSGASHQTREAAWGILTQNVGRFVRGEPLENLVDKRRGY